MINFPNAPTGGQIYTSGGTSWAWDGTKWTAASGGSTAYAPLNAPVFTGDARAVTPALTDNDTSIATTAFVKAAIIAAGQIFYCDLTDAADVATYKRLLLAPSVHAETTASAVCTGTTTDFLIASFITDPGVPGAIDFPAGSAYRRLYGAVSGGAARFGLQVYSRTAAGVETLVRDEVSNNFTDTTATLQEWLATPSTGGSLSATDRIVVKISARRISGPTNVTVTLYTEGTAHASQIQTTISTSASAPISATAPLALAGGNLTIDLSAYATSAAMTTADNLRVLKAGDTMTGDLTINTNLTVSGRAAVMQLDMGASLGTRVGYLDGAAGNISINGTIGIGGAVLQSPLSVRGTAANPPTAGTTRTGVAYLTNGSDTGAASIGLRTGGAGFWLQSHDGTDQSVKYPLLLNPSGGNVGVGTNAPTTRLVVAGQAAAGGIVGSVWSGPAGSDTSTFMMTFYDFTGATLNGGISRNGTNTVAYGTSSDARLKEAISDSSLGLEEVMQLKVRDYNFKGDERHEHGLVAQEVVEVYPLAVHVGGDDPRSEPWMIDYGRLTPLLIRAVQELSAKVAALEGKPAQPASELGSPA